MNSYNDQDRGATERFTVQEKAVDHSIAADHRPEKRGEWRQKGAHDGFGKGITKSRS